LHRQAAAIAFPPFLLCACPLPKRRSWASKLLYQRQWLRHGEGLPRVSLASPDSSLTGDSFILMSSLCNLCLLNYSKHNALEGKYALNNFAPISLSLISVNNTWVSLTFCRILET
jgi:hypothetical protein